MNPNLTICSRYQGKTAYFSSRDTSKLRFNTKKKTVTQAFYYIMNSVVSRSLHEEVPGVCDVARQGRGSRRVRGCQIDLPLLVSHPAREVPVRRGHTDLHPDHISC